MTTNLTRRILPVTMPSVPSSLIRSIRTPSHIGSSTLLVNKHSLLQSSRSSRFHSYTVRQMSTSNLTTTNGSTHASVSSSSSSSSTPSPSLTDVPPPPLFLSTRDTLTNRVIVRDLGLVVASAFRSRNLFIDVWVALTRIFGGETPDYTILLNECTEKATQRLEATARAGGATSVINVRYAVTTTMNRMIVGMHCSVLATGTAVIDIPIEQQVEYEQKQKQQQQQNIQTQTTRNTRL